MSSHPIINPASREALDLAVQNKLELDGLNEKLDDLKESVIKRVEIIDEKVATYRAESISPEGWLKIKQDLAAIGEGLAALKIRQDRFDARNGKA